MNGVQGLIDFRQGDLFEPINEGEKFSIIIFNAPYLPTDETDRDRTHLTISWDGGPTGRDVIDRFISSSANFTKKGGRILLIQSDLAGIEKTVEKFSSVGFKARVVARRKLFFETIILLRAERESE